MTMAELHEKLKERIRDVKECYDKEIKPYYDARYNFINVTGLSKEEQDRLINTRNCLLVQKNVYEEVLGYIGE